MKTFDGYEIHGVAEFTDVVGYRFCEQVPDEDAQFWSLYGHIPGGGLECIGDFKTRRFAEQVLSRITGDPPCAELLDALHACVSWWDAIAKATIPAEEPEAFRRSRALLAKVAA